MQIGHAIQHKEAGGFRVLLQQCRQILFRTGFLGPNPGCHTLVHRIPGVAAQYGGVDTLDRDAQFPGAGYQRISRRNVFPVLKPEFANVPGASLQGRQYGMTPVDQSWRIHLRVRLRP